MDQLDKKDKDNLKELLPKSDLKSEASVPSKSRAQSKLPLHSSFSYFLTKKHKVGPFSLFYRGFLDIKLCILYSSLVSVCKKTLEYPIQTKNSNFNSHRKDIK